MQQEVKLVKFELDYSLGLWIMAAAVAAVIAAHFSNNTCSPQNDAMFSLTSLREAA
jgi:hypothetical protein